MEPGDPPGPGRRWTFLTNHARVLIAIARDPDVLVRELAAALGVTERAAGAIVTDLQTAGYITRTRIGRRNHYAIDPRHALHGDAGRLLRLFTAHDQADAAPWSGGVEPAPGGA
ncbi:hypothetical protein GCM10029978_074570 [Actinoallomurus acanthiterrae]